MFHKARSFGKREFVLPTMRFGARFDQPGNHGDFDAAIIDFDTATIKIDKYTILLDDFVNFLHQIWYLETRPRPHTNNLCLIWDSGYGESYYKHGEMKVMNKEWDAFYIVAWYMHLLEVIVEHTSAKHGGKESTYHKWYVSLLIEIQGGGK